MIQLPISLRRIDYTFIEVGNLGLAQLVGTKCSVTEPATPLTEACQGLSQVCVEKFVSVSGLVGQSLSLMIFP